MAVMDGTGPSIDDVVMTVGEFVAAWAEHERRGVVLALAARRLEMCGAWSIDGSLSMAAWLRHHCRMNHHDAAGLVHRGRFLDAFPVVADAARGGVLSIGQTDTIRAACPPALEPVMDDQQALVVTIVAPLSVAETRTVMGVWRQRAEALVDLPEPDEPQRSLRTAVTADGMVGNFVLDTAGATQVRQALRTASTWDGSDDTRDNPHRSADALVDICAFFNTNHHHHGTPRQRPHVELVVDADSLSTTAPLGWTIDHTLLPASTTDMLLCDCVIHRVARAGSTVLDYGRATRTVPINLFRAVAARDQGCRYPGCDRPVAWCDAHHIRYWRRGGPTTIDNLVMLCNRHHHHVHRTHLPIKLLPNTDLEITLPDNTTRTSRPHAPPQHHGP